MSTDLGLSELPFCHITNVELYGLLETTESYINSCLENNNFSKHMLEALPENGNINIPCNYYSIEDINNKSHTGDEINLIHCNIRSIDKHYGELLALKESLTFRTNFIALSEIGTKNIDSREASLKNIGLNFKYEIPSKSKGGVGLIYDENTSVIERTDLKLKRNISNDIELDIENLWVETNDNLVIGVIYRHPGGNKEGLDIFTKYIENNMIKINQEKKKCIITGDLNIDGLKIDQCNHICNFFDSALEQYFIPTISHPTRITEKSISLIDHIIINHNFLKASQNVSTGILYHGMTDHLPIHINVKTLTREEKETRPKIRIYGTKNMENYKRIMSSSDWTEFYYTEDINKAVDILYKTHIFAFNKAFPLKQLSRKRAKDKKWVTTGLKKSIQEKSKLYKLYLSKPTMKNKQKYSAYRNILTSCIRKAEDLYFMKLMENTKNNLFHLWKVFGSIINPKKIKRDNQIKELLFDNKKLTSNVDIANAMNEYFTSIGETLNANITSNKESKTYLKNRTTQTFFLFPTDSEEIIKLIGKINPRKAGGSDNISPKILRENISIYADKLTHIINLSFKTGIVPEKFKLGKVIPIFKKENNLLPENYRPITLLSSLNKILEQVMYNRIYSFLIKHDILYKYQFGFRLNHSTSLALIEIIDNIMNKLEQDNYVAGIFLDLSKAFDTVDHTILLEKLEHYGIRGLTHSWFKSYLTNRKQYVVINNTQSTVRTVKCGVPQGSVLGPLLFLIYVNDIATSLEENNIIRLFADDTNIFMYNKSPQRLKENMNSAISNLFEWFNANKLTVNLGKTSYTIFKKKKKKTPSYLNDIKIGNTVIHRVKSSKYLGVTIDENLDWKHHISNLKKSLIKIKNSFKIIKNHVPEHNKIQLFNSYFYSKIQYGIEVYGQASSKLIKQLQIQQSRALKILFNKDFLTPTLNLHKEFNVLMVNDVYKSNILKFVFKQQNNMTPALFKTFFIKNGNIHDYNTRQKKHLYITRLNKRFSKKRIKYQGSILWNSTPKEIKSIKSVKSFSKAMKKYFVSQY